MAETISRKAKGVRRQSRRQGAGGRSRGGGGSLVDTLARMLPLTEEQWHKVFTTLILLAALGLALGVAVFAGVTDMVRTRIAESAAASGYEVRRVEVRGVERMNELAVYERVLGERNRAMTELDLPALRQSLLALPYVQDARVARQLPDGLIIDIVEREPHAVLREAGRLMLIDRDGHRLQRVRSAAGMLLVEGEGAPEQVGDLERLLDTAPDLRPHVREAEWVGSRRWNLTFGTGQSLALPQGEDRAAAALKSFAQLDGSNGLIGGRVAAFDMRSPERMYLRVPGRAEEARAALTQEGT